MRLRFLQWFTAPSPEKAAWYQLLCGVGSGNSVNSKIEKIRSSVNWPLVMGHHRRVNMSTLSVRLLTPYSQVMVHQLSEPVDLTTVLGGTLIIRQVLFNAGILLVKY